MNRGGCIMPWKILFIAGLAAMVSVTRGESRNAQAQSAIPAAPDYEAGDEEHTIAINRLGNEIATGMSELLARLKAGQFAAAEVELQNLSVLNQERAEVFLRRGHGRLRAKKLDGALA